MTEKKTVKSCKNCTISEIWMQVTGMPKELNPANPYPSFYNLRKSLEKKYKLQCGVTDKNKPVLFNIKPGSHQMSLCPSFWNGEIRWEKDGKAYILRTGHQFFAFHSLFKYRPYTNYEYSFETKLKEIIAFINSDDIFKAVQIIVRYINTIEIPKKEDGSFDIDKYLNISFSNRLNHPILTSQFNYEFKSFKHNGVIGVNTAFKENRVTDCITSVVQTTGVILLENQISLNDQMVFKEIKSIKDELRKYFFDLVTDKTKNEIMEVQYEQ